MGEPPLPEWLMHFTGFVFPWWANLMVHSTILISAGLFAAYAFRNRGAAVQSLILRITLAAVLFSPIVTLASGRLGVRGVDIPLPSAVTAALETGRAVTAAERVIPPRIAPVAVVLPATSAAPPNAAETAAYESARTDIMLHTVPPPLGILRVMIPAITVIWAILSLVLIIRLLYFFLKIHRVRCSAFDARPDLARVCESVADELEVEPPLMLQSGAVNSPFLTGLFHPAVLLPFDDGESEPLTREVLLHELGHLVRRDCLWNLLSQIAVTLFSLQPLLRVLSCRMEEVSDHVCDDFVVTNSPNRQAYARHLFDIAQRYKPTPAELAIGVGIVAFRSSLGQRIERILDSSRHFSLRTSAAAAVRVMILGGLATLLMGFTGFRGTVVSGVAGIAKAVSERETTVVEELKAIPVAILPVIAGKKAPAKINDPTVPETSPVNANTPFGTNPAASAMSPPGETPLPAVAATIPDASSPATAVSPATTGERAATPSTGNAGGAGLGANETAAPRSAESSTRQGDTTESTTSPAQTAFPAKVEALPPSLGQDALPAATAAKEPVLRLTDKESCIREGNRMLDKSNYAAAEKAFMKAAEFDLKDPEIMNLLGKAYYGKREYDKAIIAYKSAVAKKTNFADAYYNMGDVYLAQGKQDEAMTQYKAAIRLNPAYSKRTRSFY